MAIKEGENIVKVEPDEEKEELKRNIEALEHQNEAAISAIRMLQERVRELEGSAYHKLFMKVRALKVLLRSNYSSHSNGNFLKKMAFAFTKKGIEITRRTVSIVLKNLYLLSEIEKVIIISAKSQTGQVIHSNFDYWLSRHLPSETDLKNYRQQGEALIKRPIFSIVIPVYNPKINHFEAALNSILAQTYPHWEVCLADDCSTDPKVRKCIERYISKDKRIKAVFREENGHISAASNSALELVTGDYTVLMDQDDLITPDALFQNAKVVNEHPIVDLIYSDEDKIDDEGAHSEPHCKPDWCPDNIMSRNYLGHLTVFKTEIMRRIGGWRLKFEGSQDYDLVLRFTEETDAIYHIPRILYHWRIHETSAAGGEEAKPYAYIAAKRALEEAMKRRNEPGTVDFLPGFRGYSIRYKLKNEGEKVSIIIPTKDKTDLLRVCIDSIVDRSSHQNYEILVIDNNSAEKEFFDYMDACKAKLGDKFKCITAAVPFNFSKLMNIGAAESTGDYLVLLNNDTEVISPDWMEGMMEQAQRPSIGVVGVKLLYPNDTIQHAGVVMGLGGAAGHVLVGEDRDGPGYFNYVNLISNYSAVTAACVMVKKSVYEEVEGFDEKFTVEYNDIDFCLRVKETGRNNIYLPHVELYHHESISRGHPHATKESYDRHIKEVGFLKNRWENYIENDPCYNPNLSLGAHDFSLKY